MFSLSKSRWLLLPFFFITALYLHTQRTTHPTSPTSPNSFPTTTSPPSDNYSPKPSFNFSAYRSVFAAGTSAGFELPDAPRDLGLARALLDHRWRGANVADQADAACSFLHAAEAEVKKSGRSCSKWFMVSAHPRSYSTVTISLLGAATDAGVETAGEAMNVNNFCRNSYSVAANMKVFEEVRNRTDAWLHGVDVDRLPTAKDVERWKHHATCNLARAAASCQSGFTSIHSDRFFEGGWGSHPVAQAFGSLLGNRIPTQGKKPSPASSHHARGVPNWRAFRDSYASDASKNADSLRRMASIRQALGIIFPLFHTKGVRQLSCGWKMFPSHLCNWGEGCNFGRGINGPLGKALSVPLTKELADSSGLTDALNVLGLSSVIILQRRSSLDYFISGSISQQTENWRVTGNVSDTTLDHKYSLNANSLHARIIEHRNFNQYLEVVFPKDSWMYVVSEDLMEHPVESAMDMVKMIAPSTLSADTLAVTRRAVQRHADEYIIPYNISENRDRLLAFVDKYVNNWPQFVAEVKMNGDEKELEI